MTLPLVSILDDEPEIRAMLVKALEDAGFRTISFSRATEMPIRLSFNGLSEWHLVTR